MAKRIICVLLCALFLITSVFALAISAAAAGEGETTQETEKTTEGTDDKKDEEKKDDADTESAESDTDEAETEEADIEKTETEEAGTEEIITIGAATAAESESADETESCEASCADDSESESRFVRLLQQTGFYSLIAKFSENWKCIVMIVIACVLLYLAIGKGFEPLLLIPIAFGMLLTNLPAPRCSTRRSSREDTSTGALSAMRTSRRDL